MCGCLYAVLLRRWSRLGKRELGLMIKLESMEVQDYYYKNQETIPQLPVSLSVKLISSDKTSSTLFRRP
jgi:hypothetical protein